MAVKTGRLYMGIDVGSTTVKIVVLDAQSNRIVWKQYQRHEADQAGTVLQFLQRIEADFPDTLPDKIKVFITGSGGKSIGRHIGARFIQEVNAVCQAVEVLHPDVGSVIELGGQDAKIIIFKEDPTTGKKKKYPSMNDKCAGGTGAVLDKISAKLKIPAEDLGQYGYEGLKLHHVAGKCGVFAETDINSLQKQGIGNQEMMASLFEAIVGQNLSVLTRGHTLLPKVLLLGGPNTFIRGMKEAWQANIPEIWAEREVPLPAGVEPKELIIVPDNAQYFAALGAVQFGREEDQQDSGNYSGWKALEEYCQKGIKQERRGSSVGLWTTREELQAFKEEYAPVPFRPATFRAGETVEAFIGLDGGSTSTKAVLVNKDREILAKSYQLSKGNPIEDTKDIIANLRSQVESGGAVLQVMGLGTTGYAKDILKDVLGADAAIVETVAHTESALHFYKKVDVICDVGGQDIKIMILKDGKVKDFKLNTQCSAGNGYFLQSSAQDFNIPVERYAEVAFQAEAMPTFGYGCAVFMQSDIVDFQRKGWEPKEIMAGLADVLPKNIWLYVSQMTNLANLGTHFVLQGGTQHNLAAVKAQVDFIKSRFRGDDIRPSIIVHKHCGESGAIGTALEAVRLWERGRQTTFIGLDSVAHIRYKSITSEDTRCYFCKNKCLRTFIDVDITAARTPKESRFYYKQGASEPRIKRFYAKDRQKGEGLKSNIPLAPGAKRLIVGNSCEKGLVEDVNDMREIKKDLDEMLAAHPNFVDKACAQVFKSWVPSDDKAVTKPKRFYIKKAIRERETLRIGIPRVLNIYTFAPLFDAYFQSLGIPHKNIIYSDYTSEQLYRAGSRRGAIDPCYPSKLGIPHVHNLIYKAHARTPLDIIFFPMLHDMPSDLVNSQGHLACPAVTMTPGTVKAAFTKEGDVFAKHGITYFDPLLNLGTPALCEKQLYEAFSGLLGLSRKENRQALECGYRTLRRYQATMRAQAKEVLDLLVKEQKIGMVLLGRPYHNDIGINHSILVEFQKLGYPVFNQDVLPTEGELVEELFGEEVRAGTIAGPMDISDVWKNSYSENASRKIWAAKFVARHPNLVAVEMSNFKCGHDGPTYAVIEKIIESSRTPLFSFKDLDENKPAGSIKIRVETIAYFLKRYGEDMLSKTKARAEIEQQLKQYEAGLRNELSGADLAAGRNGNGQLIPGIESNHNGESQVDGKLSRSIKAE